MSVDKIVVWDAGTDSVRCGFSSDRLPAHIFPSVVGHEFGDDPTTDFFVGNDALENRLSMKLHYPINDYVADWSKMMHIFDYGFNDVLMINPPDHKIMLSTPALAPRAHNQRTMEVLFETYEFKGLGMCPDPILTLYSSGLLTGIVVDVGTNSTRISVVYEGLVIPFLYGRVPVGGRTIERCLYSFMNSNGNHLCLRSERHSLRKIKEELCYVALDLSRETRLANETTYVRKEMKLSNGRSVDINTELFRAPEALFDPSLAWSESMGIGMQTSSIIHRADSELRSYIVGNIIVTGGSSLFPGFVSRFEKEVKHNLDAKRLRVNSSHVKVIDPRNREYSTYIGASLLGGIMKYKDSYWTMKEDYDENGVLHCLNNLQNI